MFGHETDKLKYEVKFVVVNHYEILSFLLLFLLVFGLVRAGDIKFSWRSWAQTILDFPFNGYILFSLWVS